jgi:hypothetical protein
VPLATAISLIIKLLSQPLITGAITGAVQTISGIIHSHVQSHSSQTAQSAPLSPENSEAVTRALPDGFDSSPNYQN